MARLGIIGGTGLNQLESLRLSRRERLQTPYGAPSSALTHGQLGGFEVVFLARHGYGHTIPPHQVNYRANTWALKSVGVDRLVAVAAVGGIRPDLVPAALAVPDQIIDYTYARAQTFFVAGHTPVKHIDFTQPYCEELRQTLLMVCAAEQIEVCATGTYGATQGPRLETAMEINRLERDGCDMVGMTGMPEAALARELGLCYAALAVIANRAAGRGEGPITEELLERNLKAGMSQVCRVLELLPAHLG